MSQEWDGAQFVWALPTAVRNLSFSLCKMGEGFEQKRVGIGQEQTGWHEAR